jgi:hypothetical protein
MVSSDCSSLFKGCPMNCRAPMLSETGPTAHIDSFARTVLKRSKTGGHTIVSGLSKQRNLPVDIFKPRFDPAENPKFFEDSTSVTRSSFAASSVKICKRRIKRKPAMSYDRILGAFCPP